MTVLSAGSNTRKARPGSRGTVAACCGLSVPRATYYRHLQPVQPKPAATPRAKPPRALSNVERQEVLEVLHSEPFADKAPAEIYATLLDQGVYRCSIRTMYRILDDQLEVVTNGVNSHSCTVNIIHVNQL